VPVRSGNWGPPMSHAANLGRLEIIKAIAALGAKDFQHPFDRTLLQGRIECARWLHEHGAKLAPGIVMGLDWIETPGWHEARDVTPAEWGRNFPLRELVNAEALRLLE